MKFKKSDKLTLSSTGHLLINGHMFTSNITIHRQKYKEWRIPSNGFTLDYLRQFGLGPQSAALWIFCVEPCLQMPPQTINYFRTHDINMMTGTMKEIVYYWPSLMQFTQRRNRPVVAFLLDRQKIK